MGAAWFTPFELIAERGALLQGRIGSYGDHTHAWKVDPALPKPTVFVENRYPRIASVIPVGAGYMADGDTCDAAGCPYGNPGWVSNGVRVLEWSDQGAGGAFGKLDEGQFVTCPPEQVSHYRCPDTPSVVSLTVRVDDVPEYTDTTTEPPTTFATADDPARTSDPFALTVWDVTIEGPDAAWRPRGGAEANSTPLNLEVKPNADHNGASMQANFSVTLSASSQFGYCLNRSYQDNRDSLPDLGFARPQGNWIIPDDGQSAETAAAALTATLTASSLDYGGWGSVTAWATGVFGMGAARDKRRPPSGPNVRYGCNIPWDEDGDHVADGHDNHVGENGYSGPNNTRDAEALRSTQIAGFRGDGFTVYEEYRGLFVQGAWRILNPTLAEVFVEDVHGLGTAGFNQTGLTIIFLAAADSQQNVVNWTSPAETRILQQWRIRLVNGGQHPLPTVFGEAVGGPNIPSQVTECRVYLDNIVEFAQDNPWFVPPGQAAAFVAFETHHMVSHELAHAVNVPHHPGEGPRVCYMQYFSGVFPPPAGSHTIYCTQAHDPNYNEVNRLLRLRGP
jgi:hypothetical protein